MKISQEIKKNGKVSFDAPKVKGRKHFAPATKKEKVKKGKGSYDRSKGVDEDEEYGEVPLRKTQKDEDRGEVPMKPDHWGKSKPKKKSLGKRIADKFVNKKTSGGSIKENVVIMNMVEAIINKNYSAAHKYLTQAVETKLQTKIEAQIDTPIFN